MITVKVGSRKVKVLRTWEKRAIGAVAIALFFGMWINGILGSWT